MNILISFDLKFITSKQIESFYGGNCSFMDNFLYVQNFMDNVS